MEFLFIRNKLLQTWLQDPTNELTVERAQSIVVLPQSGERGGEGRAREGRRGEGEGRAEEEKGKGGQKRGGEGRAREARRGGGERSGEERREAEGRKTLANKRLVQANALMCTVHALEEAAR